MAIVNNGFLPAKVAVSVRGEPTMEYAGRLLRLLAKFLFRFADRVILQTKQAQNFFPQSGTEKKQNFTQSNQSTVFK